MNHCPAAPLQQLQKQPPPSVLDCPRLRYQALAKRVNYRQHNLGGQMANARIPGVYRPQYRALPDRSSPVAAGVWLRNAC
jgi:hypothetical protein